ncbi:MAG: GNAT family N-acetyltransferase [Bacteroidales bacterium]|nr:GNAT family N-acetyltransferase [Bacteroidales bacterium]
MDITTERLILKEVTRKDITTIYTIHSLPEVDEFNTLGIPESIKVTKKLIQPYLTDQRQRKRKLFYWIVRLKDSNEAIGTCGLSLAAERFKMGEIYYSLIPSHWGKGLGTEVAQSLINYGFNSLHLHRIEAGVATDNIRSIKVLEKAGMIREGTRRKILPIRGEWKDNFHYAILESDFKPI